MVRQAIIGALVWLALALSALAEKRVALVIAASDYDTIRPLANPQNDARAMEDLLKSLGFEVVVETNRDLRRMRRALEDFKQDAAGADVALLFFSGHGVALDGVNYLLPTDTDASSAERLAATALPMSEAQDALKAVAPVAIVLLDACRNDPFATGATGSEDGRGAGALDGAQDALPPPKGTPVPGLGRVGRADGVLFAFAAAPNETASDGSGTNSPFTAALVRHLGTAGVELRTALTLVQQDVYDRSRGKQLPYIESGLPELVFISGQGVLPERDQLLIAMAKLTPDLRAEVEALAAERNMPLAPLYAALLSADLEQQTAEERARLLEEAAVGYEQFQSELQRFQSDDPRVAELRARAEEQLTLGAFDTARAILTEAAEIDSSARTSMRETFVSRTLSEAVTHLLNANAARTDLRYDLAIADLTKVTALYAEIEPGLLDRETQFTFMNALEDLGDLQLVAGNTQMALDAFTRRSQFVQARVEADPTDVDWVHELIWSLTSVGNVLQQQGYLTEAETAYSSALEFSQWQADERPDDPALMRDRQAARKKLGEIRYARNDFPGALEAFREALALSEALLALDPTNPDDRRDYSFTQGRIGDVLIATGDREGAREAYAISQRVTEDLLAEFPDNNDIRRGLSVSYERQGDMLVGELDYDAGLAAYGEALVIREELAALDPDNTLRQRDLAITFENIADINRLRGDSESALLAYQAALAIREKLAALDPTNMLWQHDLSVSLERLGDFYQAENDLVAALAAYERSRALRETIVMLDPENLPRQRDLGVAIERVANVKLAMGDREGAFALHDAALYLRKAMMAANPSVAQYQRDASYSYLALGKMLVEDGDFETAETLFAEAVYLRTRLVGAAPNDITALRELSEVQNRHSDVLLQLGRQVDALAASQDALATAERVLQLAPEVPDHLHDRLTTLNRMGDAQAALGDFAAAVDTFRAMAADGSRLLDIDPYNTGWANELSLAMERLGTAQAEMGDDNGALKSQRDALALREWLNGQDQANPDWYRNLAVSYERVGTMLARLGDDEQALEHQEMSLSIMRDLSAAYPDDPFLELDVVRALDLKAALLQDPTGPSREALAILEAMQAAGRLPQGYEDWIPAFRQSLGLP